jgi:hypothetical protein
VGTVKDWVELGRNAKHDRYVTLKIGNRTIEVKHGDDLVEVLERYRAEQGQVQKK